MHQHGTSAQNNGQQHENPTAQHLPGSFPEGTREPVSVPGSNTANSITTTAPSHAINLPNVLPPSANSIQWQHAHNGINLLRSAIQNESWEPRSNNGSGTRQKYINGIDLILRGIPVDRMTDEDDDHLTGSLFRHFPRVCSMIYQRLDEVRANEMEEYLQGATPWRRFSLEEFMWVLNFFWMILLLVVFTPKPWDHYRLKHDESWAQFISLYGTVALFMCRVLFDHFNNYHTVRKTVEIVTAVWTWFLNCLETIIPKHILYHWALDFTLRLIAAGGIVCFAFGGMMALLRFLVS